MAKKLYNETDIQNIATSIRNKNKSQNTYKVSEMANAIGNIVTDSIYPKNVQNLAIKKGNEQLTISWKDPTDTVVENQTICTWAGTKVVYKEGSYPTSPTDGTVAIDNKVRDAYENGYTITGLTNGITYYFRLFPYSENDVYNMDSSNEITGTPVSYVTMTVEIDLSNSNPETSCTYKDDAVEMTPGSSAWDEFFGHYPCLFKNGEEVGKLNPNDFTKFEDGTAADITSGNAGDVMICFPRRGVKISTTGNILTVSMTDAPNDENFEYYAHSRDTVSKEKFYLGAYKGYSLSNKLRSLSGKTITADKTIGSFRTLAQANGSGYEQSGFYQLTFRQVMYILKYKNLDSQTKIGKGYVTSNSSAKSTGGTNAYGMDCELIKQSNPTYMTDGKHQVKCFGLEDFWGNVYEWIDGLVTDSSRNILTATTGFNDSGNGYTNQGLGASSNIGNYMSKPHGTSEKGFIAKEVSGSSSTYFCDSAYLYAGYVARFGGYWYDGSDAGAFYLLLYDSASASSASIAARLMYL